MTTKIVVRLQIEGLHCWPAAKDIFPEVAYLSDPHRHVFYIECKKEVFHDDRDVEFIMFKHEIQKYFSKYYKSKIGMCDFGSMSCEMIAKELLTTFDCSFVSVFEDNENGAEVDAMTYYGHTSR